MYTSTSVPLGIAAIGISAGAPMLPPAFSFSAGWNLVGVVSLSGQDAGIGVSADGYLSGLSWTQAIGYNPSTGTFTTLLPNGGANLIVGQGYYVYLEKAGTLVP